MQTKLPDSLLATTQGKQADAILRKCVHCGFCTATCPTYQILGDELDSPRGRIYLIKQMLEGEPVTRKTQLHLDRCLTCRSCETTCPSGVEYGHLIDIGRSIAEQKIKRHFSQRLFRKYLSKLISSNELFSFAFKAGRAVRWGLPVSIKNKLHKNNTSVAWSHYRSDKKIILLTGCAQASMAPEIDKQLSHLLAASKVETYPIAGCCGSAAHHLGQEKPALKYAKFNIDNWYKKLNNGFNAICMSASGCGIAIKEYKHLFPFNSTYYKKAEFIADKFKDPIELLDVELLQKNIDTSVLEYAFHPPCTLQHGLHLDTKVEKTLNEFGLKLKPFSERHLCCGSAGTYSITQAKISNALLQRKLDHIESQSVDMILTANIGCMNHLQGGTRTPVRHWISEVYKLIQDN